MWIAEKISANIRYLDEQTGDTVERSKSGSKLTFQIRVYWTWDWTIIARIDGSYPFASGPGVVSALCALNSNKDPCYIGSPSLTGVPFAGGSYRIPRAGGGHWVTQSCLAIWDIKRDRITTQAIVVGQWDAWCAYSSPITSTKTY